MDKLRVRHWGGPTPRLLLAAWLLAGIVLLSQARLPSPPAAAAVAAVRRPAGCWVVQVATARRGGPSLAPELRRLRSYGLAATVLRSKHWRAIEPGRQLLIVPASSHARAKAIRARVAGLGHHAAVVRRAPATACRR